MSDRPGFLSSMFGVKDDAGASKGLPYRLRDKFLSDAELSFYRVLRVAVGDSYTICPKVNLHDVFAVTGPGENRGSRNRIASKHIDFLLCDRMTIRPVLGLELDERSHECANQPERDSFMDDLFMAANLPLGRVFVADSYDPADLRRFVFEATGVDQFDEVKKPGIPLGPEARAENPVIPCAQDTFSPAVTDEEQVEKTGDSLYQEAAAGEEQQDQYTDKGEELMPPPFPPGEGPGEETAAVPWPGADSASQARLPEDGAADTVSAGSQDDMPGNEAQPDLDIRKWREKLMQELAATVSSVNAPLCPLCKIEMVLCTSKRGIQYYSCANSPRCRQVRGLLE